MKYGLFNGDGLPKAFYDTEINSIIPDGSVALTEIQWMEFNTHRGFRKWNGSDVETYAKPVPVYDEDTVVNTIKTIAGNVITKALPAYKQRNYTARALEVMEAKSEGTATEADLQEMTVIKGIWEKVKSVRGKSNELEIQYKDRKESLSSEDIDVITTELSTELSN